jgi:beta-lactamase superfamily II metal-dependent hydrolase
MTNKSFRDYINLIENAQQGVAEGSGTTPKITFAQQTPGSWTRIDILVDGDVKFQAVKTMGPGHWTIHDQDGEVIGDGGNKTQLKASVLDYLSRQGVAEEQLDETTPEAIAKINQITRK